MSNQTDRQLLEAMVAAFEPYLSSDGRKVYQRLKAILDLFPGQSLTDIEKNVQGLMARAPKNVPAIAERAHALVGSSSAESPAEIMKAASSLSAAEVKDLGKALDLELPAGKPRALEALRLWLESGGRVTPQTAGERMRAKAKEYAGDLTTQGRVVDYELADAIIQRAEAASADRSLGTDGFKEFARLLGIFPVHGPKGQMLEQVKDYVNQLAVSHQQTQFGSRKPTQPAPAAANGDGRNSI